MGLDISVYKDIQLIENDEDCDFSFIAYVACDDWKYKIKNLKDGGYCKLPTHAKAM